MWLLALGAIYGLQDRHSVGGHLELDYKLPIYAKGPADGAMIVGGFVGYEIEPYAQADFLLGGARAFGAAHRWQTFALVEHRVRFAKRFDLGLGLFAGWTHVFVRGGLLNASRGIDGAYAFDRGVVTTGLLLTLGVQLTERFGLIARAMAPFPYAPGEMTSYLLATLALSIQF